ncbi:MAG: hypothetical protein ACTSQN_07330 [Candidatus Heimdallarchaeota archaeon]
MFFFLVSQRLRVPFFISLFHFLIALFPYLPSFFRGLFRLFLLLFLGVFVMVKRSVYARVPPVPSGWLTKTCPTPRDFPFERLLPGELRFFKSIVGRSLFSKDELIDLLHDCFGELVSSLSDDSLGGNLFVGECYADREYFSRVGVSRGFIRVFRLGLVCAVPMPIDSSRFQYWFCYPRMSPPYRLLPSNFSRPFPPHSVFSSWCFSRLRSGLGEDDISEVDPGKRAIPLLGSDSEYVSDHSFRVHARGVSETFWFEVHTGSEGYDESVFIPRLLAAEHFLKGKGRFVVIVPFKRDRDRALRAIKNYNKKAELTDSKPSLDLAVSEIITYFGIDAFREKLGFYHHLTRV